MMYARCIQWAYGHHILPSFALVNLLHGAMHCADTLLSLSLKKDGIIGFSQGANVACMYAAHLEAGSIPGPPLKFVISMSGSRSGWDKQLADLFKTPLSTPSL